MPFCANISPSFVLQEVENTPKLEAFLNAVNSDDNSRLVTVPPGPHVLSDILLSSPIVQGDMEGGGMGGGAMAPGGAGPGAEGFAEFGVDPTMDPEFAWALRVSMEEERQRQEAEAKKRADEAGGTEAAPADGSASSESKEPSSDVTMPDTGVGAGVAGASGELDEAALLEAAIAMSMPADASMTTPAASAPPETPGAPVGAAAAPNPNLTPAVPTPAVPDITAAAEDVAMVDGEDEDEAMQLALAMSMSQAAESTPAPAPAPAPAAASTAMFQDANFLQSVLGSLPGVDPNDPRIQSVISGVPQAQAKKDGEKPEKKDP